MQKEMKNGSRGVCGRLWALWRETAVDWDCDGPAEREKEQRTVALLWMAWGTVDASVGLQKGEGTDRKRKRR